MHQALLICLIACALCTTSMAATTHKPRPAKQIYQGKCAVCHMNGVAGAPKAFNQTDWQPRLAQALKIIEKKHPALNKQPKQQKAAVLTFLAKRVKSGWGEMPPGGMCFDCTTAEYIATIRYMLSTPKRHNR